MHFKNLLEALLTFLFGVLFAYITWPFFTSLITALDGAGDSFEDWQYVKGIAWIGLIGIYILMIIVLPYYLAIVKDNQEGPQ